VQPRPASVPRRGLLLYGCAWLAGFLVYWTTLSRGVLGGDAGELQFVPPILGLPHPTGYPLQVLLHKLWSYAPIGSVAYRLNLLDAAIGASAVVLVIACGVKIAGRPLPALLAGSIFALGELWWSQAVTADKYTLNGLFLAATLLCYLRWRTDRTRGALRLLALTYGLSLTHHRSMLLVAPALMLGLLLEGWRPPRWRESLLLASLVLAPLALYAYVPWAGARGLPPGSWRVDTPQAFLEFLMDPGYTSQIRPDSELAGRLAEEMRVLFRSYGPIGVALGLVGMMWVWRRDRRLGAVLALAFLPQAVLGASYRLESNYALPRHWVFFLPAFLIWALWIAGGAEAIWQAVERLGGSAAPEAGRSVSDRHIVAGLLALALLAGQAATVWARTGEARVRAQFGAETLDGYRQDLQRSPLAERFGRLAFDAAAPNSTIVCDWEQATVLWYLQQVERRRPDVTIRYPMDTLDELLVSARRDDRPLYVARTMPGLEARGVPSSVGPLLQLWPPPAGWMPIPATPVVARLEPGLGLIGIADHSAELRPGGVLAFTLFWRAERPLARDYSISARLVGADGQTVAQHDERHPALGSSPTSGWRPRDVVGDYHELPIGNRLGAGSYRLMVVVYQPDPIQNVRLLDPSGQPGPEAIEVMQFQIEPSSSSALRWLRDFIRP
jgi:hypothetical protein